MMGLEVTNEFVTFLLIFSITNEEDEDVKEVKVERKSLPELLNLTRGGEHFGKKKNSTYNKTLIIEKETRTRLVLDQNF